MFSIMEPILFPLTFLYIVIEIFVDAQKLKYIYLRPIPQKAQNIGATESILVFVGWASAFSNDYIATMVACTRFAEPFFLKYGYGGKLVVFVVAEHLLIMAKYFASLWFGAIPWSLRVQQERQRFIQNNVIESVLRENMYDFKIEEKERIKTKIEKDKKEFDEKNIDNDSAGEEIDRSRSKVRSLSSSHRRRNRSSSRSRKRSIIRIPSIFSKKSD